MTVSAASVHAFFALRSLLFVPGDRVSELLSKALDSGTDAVILDLEDSVAPARKADARRLVSESMQAIHHGMMRLVRINSAGSPWWVDDVRAACDAGADALMIPKASVDAISAVTGRVASGANRHNGLPGVVALVETPAGVLTATEIAAHPEVMAIALGAEDLAASMGLVRTDDEAEIDFVRASLSLASAASGRPAIDTPTIAHSDLDLTKRQADRARTFGFSAKMAIHPRQVPIINRVFGPTPSQVAWARRVTDEAARAAPDDSGVVVVDGRMVDAPVVSSARRVLQRLRDIDTEGNDGA